MMKTMIQILLVALIFGGASAGGSLYWLKLNKKPVPEQTTAKTDQTDAKDDNQVEKDPEAESPEIVETPPASAFHEALSELKPGKLAPKNEPVSFGPPVAARPPFNPNADEAGELIYKLRVRLASSTRQERRVSEREEAMKLILDDLGAEHRKTIRLKKQLFEEQAQFVTELDTLYGDLAVTKRLNEEKIEAALREKEEAISDADEQVKAAREEIDDLRKQLDEVQKPFKDRSGSPELSTNLKKAAETLDSMPPEDAAKILKETVNEGRTEAVVALLNAMKPRVCAKVMTEITSSDPELAADLVERLKRLKKEGNATAPATK